MRLVRLVVPILRRCLEQVVLNLCEPSLLALRLLLLEIASRLKFAAYALLVPAADAVDLGEVAPDDQPVVRFGEKPPQQAFRVEGEAPVVDALVGEDCEIASVPGPVNSRPVLHGAIRK